MTYTYSRGDDFRDIAKDDPTGNWNISQEYSDQLILSWLIKCNDYITTAKFGTISILDSLQLPVDSSYIVPLKLSALERLCDGIVMLYDNSIFAIKYPNDRESMKKLKDAVVFIQSKLALVRKKVKRNEEEMIVLNEDIFDKFLNELRNILSDMKFYMNRSNLIFIHKEAFNPKEAKKKMMDEMTKSG